MTHLASFRDLDAWQLSMKLVELIYELSRSLPTDEFDLRRQMRVACRGVSSPTDPLHRPQRRLRHFRLPTSDYRPPSTEYRL